MSNQIKKGGIMRAVPASISLPLATLFLLTLTGCSTLPPSGSAQHRQFDFQHDTFSFANQLKWEYHFDEQGHWKTSRREPSPTYYQHCFVVARSARQFFLNARFEPDKPRLTRPQYTALIEQVVHSSPRRELPEADKIVIPGYSDLKQFSTENEVLLKRECGGAWQSYVQRGHWRMLFPFSRSNQQHAAEQLREDLRGGTPVVAHIVRFPQLTINHAVVFFDAKPGPDEITFSIYDPNSPEAPRQIIFDREKRTFFFAANDYFPGGRVDVYEIYKDWRY